MALYMISGRVSEDCTIRVIQDEEFKAEKFISTGPYTIYFESDSVSLITAVAENRDGILVNFGSIRPVEVLKPDVLSKKS